MAKFINIKSLLIILIINKIFAFSEIDTIKTNTLKFINIYFDTISISKPKITIDNKLFEQINNQTNINLTGWKSFEINSNPNSINAINQSLYLKFNGKFYNKYQIKGYIKDYNNPYDEFDEIRKLNNLDQIYFEITGKNILFKGGNFTTNNANSQNRILGISTTYKKYSLTSGIIQSKFGVYSFYGKDGINGPYFLKTNDNGSYIIIIKNSEKIYKNNRLLKKGIDNDYTIDYITGAIYFNSDSLINSTDRFYVEFMYSQNSYKRYLISSNIKINKYISIEFNKISDIKESPDYFELTDEIKKQLKNANKNDTIIILPGVIKSNSGNYILKDNHYEYIGNNNGNFILSFYYVGENKGDYSYIGNGIYEYTPSAGNYKIGNIITTPKNIDYMNIAIDNYKNLNLKLSLSRTTPNNFINYSKNGIQYDLSYNFKNLKFISYYKDSKYSSIFQIFNNYEKQLLLIPEHIFLQSISTNSLIINHKKGKIKINHNNINKNYQILNINNLLKSNFIDILQNFTINKERKIFINNRINTKYKNIKLEIYNEYKPDTLFLNDSSYIFNNITTSFKNFSIKIGNENFYNNKILNNSFFTINSKRAIYKKNFKSNISLSYKIKRWIISKKTQNFYILSYKVKYNYDKIKINIDHFNNMQESFKFARKFIKVSRGIGNYSFDSTLNGYVPDEHGDYILKKEIIKNTEPTTKTQNEINFSFQPYNFLKFNYLFSNETQLKSNKPNIKYFISFPFKYKKNLLNSNVVNHNLITSLLFNAYKISYQFNQTKQFIGIYTNYSSEKNSILNSIKISRKNINIIIGNSNNTQNENNLSNIKYQKNFITTEYKKNIITTQSGIEIYNTSNNQITNFTLQSNIDYKIATNNFLNILFKINFIKTNLRHINYFILYGKQKGTNIEININFKKNIFQHNTLNFNFFIRKYGNEKIDQNFNINIHSYF